MHTEKYKYKHDEQEFHGFLAYDESAKKPRPAVMIVHDWSGCNEFARKKAERLAEMGYLGFAVDMYGEGRMGETIEEKQALMEPLMNDRQLLRERLIAALNTVKGLPETDQSRIAAMGFCFGGLCVLDLARSGAEVNGVVSVHGLLNKPEGIENQKIKAKILALHGYDDPMVPPEQVNTFCDEMTKDEADWQVHMYGHTKHAFTNPEANNKDLGTIYNPLAEKRSMLAAVQFLDEMFSNT